MLFFLVFVLIAALWLQIRSVKQEAEVLRGRVDTQSSRWLELQAELVALRRKMDYPTETAAPSSPPEPVKPEAVPVSIRPLVATPAMPPPLPVAPSIPAEPDAAEPEPQPVFADIPKPAGGWEELIGGNVLNKLGALLLVIGIALFLSYSFAHMGPAGITSTAAGLGAAMLAGGTCFERRERYRIFSRGVIAAGWAALYFTSYAAYSLPAAKVINNPAVGVAVMILIAIGMVAHSLRYRVQSLTSLAYGCVFAALALNDQNTFAAIALIPLAASMLFLARRFQWYGMALFGAAAAYGTFLTRPSTGAPLLAIQSMLLIFWLMFEAFDLLRIHSHERKWPANGALFSLNALAGLGASAAIWYRLAPNLMWQFCSAGAALYVASMWIRFGLGEDSFYEYALTVSAFLAGLAIFAGVPGLWISLGVMAEAEVLFLAGRYLNLRFARALSLIGFLAALLQLINRIDQTTIVWGTSIDTWAPPLAVMALVFYVNRFVSKQSRYFGYAASTLLAVILGFELPWRFAGAGWLMAGLVLLEFGIQKGLFDFRLQGYGLAAIGAIGTGLSYLDPLHVRNGWVYGGAAAISLAMAIRATRSLTSLREIERRFIRIGGATAAAVLSAALVTRLAPEAYWGVAMMGISVLLFELTLAALPAEMFLPAFGVNAAAVLRLIVEHASGIQKHPAQSVWIAFTGAAAAYYWITLRLLRSSDDDSTPIRLMAPWLGSIFALITIWMVLPDAFVPIAAGVLALLITEAGLAIGERNLIWLGRAAAVIATFSVLLEMLSGSKWVVIGNSFANAVIQWIVFFRARRHPIVAAHSWFAAGVIAAALFNQVSGGMLTLSWSLEGIGLLSVGFAARERTLRLSGLTLLLICIGKVFFYDLRNLETIYRILSFIGLGIILLAVSWIYTRFKEQLQRYL